MVLVGLAALTNKPTPHSTLGNDISYPQCNGALPAGQAFGIVGVNGGIASSANPCLKKQLAWAAKSSDISLGQPRVQLYLNTGNPGDQPAPTWPHDNKDPFGRWSANPYGQCHGNNSLACGWQYGWNQATKATRAFLPAAAKSAHVSPDPHNYLWWLDVETKNSWQFDSPDGLARNRASLEGVLALLRQDMHLQVGVYSTSYQWHKITGDIPTTSNLTHLDSWLAGANNAEDARERCASPSLTAGGKVLMVQFVAGTFDYNYSCLQIDKK